MAYMDGFVIAVPTANRQAFIDHALEADTIFTELGATRVVECWGTDVPEGKQTDLRRAVQAPWGAFSPTDRDEAAMPRNTIIARLIRTMSSSPSWPLPPEAAQTSPRP